MTDGKKTIFFLVSSKHELWEFTKILKKINLKNHKLYLLIENSERNQNVDLNFNSNINTIFLPNIYPSKNLVKNIFLKKEIIKILKKINLCKDDLFIFFHNSSLLFFIVSVFFNKYNLKKIMFVTSNFFIPNDNSSISLKETFFLNILCYPLIKKIIYKKYYKGTVFSNTYIMDKIDYVINLKNFTPLKKPITFNIKSFFIKKNNQSISKTKYLILVDGLWVKKFPLYLNTVKLLILKHGKKNILIKDHPLSDLNETDLSNFFHLENEAIIPKKIALEPYIYKNSNIFKIVYGPTSAALKYASFLGLDAICYQNLFSKSVHYRNHTSEYYMYHNNIKVISKILNGAFEFENKKRFDFIEHKLEDVFSKIL